MTGVKSIATAADSGCRVETITVHFFSLQNNSCPRFSLGRARVLRGRVRTGNYAISLDALPSLPQTPYYGSSGGYRIVWMAFRPGQHHSPTF